MLPRNLKKILISGFSFSYIFILILAALWIYDTHENNKILQRFILEYENLHLVTSMRDNAHKRTLNLYKMTNVQDVFERDALYLKILKLGEQFIKSRDKFLAKGLNAQEKLAWERARTHLTKAGNLHHLAAELVFDNKFVEARDLIVNQIVLEQKLFMQELDALRSASKASVSSQLKTIESRNQTTYLTIFFLVTFSLMIGLMGIFFYRRSTDSEGLLVEQGNRIRALYEVSTRSDLSSDEQITETLKVGCRLFNMEIGKVGKLDAKNNQSIFLNTVSPKDFPVKRGTVMPLDKTYCKLTIDASKPIAINNVGKSMYRTEPCYHFLGMEAYIGTTIRVNGKLYGTVHFSNRSPLPAFKDTDFDLINLMASWIAVTLERQITQEELKQSKEAAEQANRFKSQFLANMSHEIRTPLTSIIGYSEFLQEENEMQHKERSQTIDTIIRSGQHLHQIINNVLDLSKIEAGELKLENLPVSPFHLVIDVHNQLKKQLVEKGLLFNTHFHFPLPKTFQSDSTRIKQIMLNLCNNAMKFTERGGIDLDIFYQDNDEGQFFIFDVTDTGIGMSTEEQKHILDPFSQADSSTTRKYGGSGLGLSISKHLAEKLGGNLSLTSEKGHGSRFCVKIKLQQAPEQLVYEFNQEQQILPETAEEMPDFKAKVLLAEDNLDNQNLIALFLKKAQVKLDIAENGVEAIEMANRKNYDLILMDIQMPVMDGKEAIKILRQQGYTGPIVTVTANTLHEDLEIYKELGANDNIAKPISLKEFYKTLSKYLNNTPSFSKINVS